MFNKRTFAFVLFVAGLALTAFAEQYIITGDFVERREAWQFGYLDGKFYYLYDSTSDDKCRLRFDYNINYLNRSVISNLYHYEDRAMYSMCPEKCSGLSINELPDPWWIGDNDLFQQTTKMESGKRWYERNPANVSSSTQVMAILMTEGSTAPSNGYLSTIKFYDGRTVKFSNVVIDNVHQANDPIFSANENCPRPSCPIFADIVFVLDSSGSVDDVEWEQTVNFVGEIMDSFTFGPNAVAAAVVQFCGQDRGCNKRKIYDEDCYDVDRFWKDCNWPTTTSHPNIVTSPDLMTTVLASQDFGEGDTVSYNKEQLMRNLRNTVKGCIKYKGKCQAFAGARGTCQALGLNQAMKVFNRSPRRNYATKPNNIVIVVTDGEDKYPNATKANATLLRSEPYNAFLIEVGVGLQCEYDRRYLRSIASRLGAGDVGAYFDATDYNQILKVADEMFRPLCDSNMSSECGPECKGFCGCGECLCPNCDESEDLCHFIKCNVSGSFTNGCLVYNSSYEIVDDECTAWHCDASEFNATAGKKGLWIPDTNDCDEFFENTTGTCRFVKCDPQFGGCITGVNQSVCTAISNGCEEYECTPVGETPDDPITGCRLVKNHTQTCVDNLPQDSCFIISCDGSSSMCDDMIVDTCKSMNNACETYSCELNTTTGKYGCVGTFTRHHVNNSCTKWKCDYDGTEGWVMDINRNETTCYNSYNESGFLDDMRCKDFYCNPDVEGIVDGGCYYVNRTGCSSQCTDEKELECLQWGISNSTKDDVCVFDFCYVNHTVINETDYYIPVCASELGEAKVENCLDDNSSSAKRAKELNDAYPKLCYTPICVAGKCGVTLIDVPKGWVWDNCTEPRCEKGDDGRWNWVMRETALNLACKNDACYTRQCVPDQGCVAADNCTKYTNECYSYACVLDDNGKPKACSETDLTVNFLHLECIDEQCENGKKVPYYPPCESDNKCMKGSCVKGYCKFDPIPAPGNDLCMIYTCDNATGDWSAKPACNDGLYCTEDECWNYGSFYECHFNPIDCGDTLEMEGYDCFRPVCKEQPMNQTYRCVRKLLPNAYIDICGNCIKDNPDVFESGMSEEASENVLLTCTGAPPKPLMVEALAAGTIGLIIIGAVVVGAGLTTSSIMATKSLISRVKDASNQSAQSNPLFEGAETELQNPTYAGGVK